MQVENGRLSRHQAGCQWQAQRFGDESGRELHCVECQPMHPFRWLRACRIELAESFDRSAPTDNDERWPATGMFLGNQAGKQGRPVWPCEQAAAELDDKPEWRRAGRVLQPAC